LKKPSRPKRRKSKRVPAKKSQRRWSWVVFPALGLVVIAFLSFMLKSVIQQQQRDPVVAITSDNFQREVLKSDVPVLVDFWAPWCGPCRMFAPTVDKIAKDYAGRLKVGKVNIDDNRDLATSWAVQAIPTAMIFKDGSMVQKWVGVSTEDEVRNAVDHFVSPKIKT